jgi:xanthine dehydrogenase molybdopterin-binding subunit B
MYRYYLDEVKKLLKGEEYRIVGKNVRRVDAIEKVTGLAKYTADFLIENAFIIRLVRSPHPHARIRKIHKEDALRNPGVERVITADDIPGDNQCGYYIDDQPLIAYDKARYIGDMVALVVAKDEASAWAGADAVQVAYDELPAVFDPKQAFVVIRDGKFKGLSVALGAVAPIPIQRKRVEGMLKGKAVSEREIEEAAQMVAEEVIPITDALASATYRRDMAVLLTKRILKRVALGEK